MFQRLKGAIDSRIAEEQARQRQPHASGTRSASNAGRSSSRNISPSKRVPRQIRGRQDGEPPAKGPDPSEFEPEFVIEDDEQSRSRTPRPANDRKKEAATEPEQTEVPRGDGSLNSSENSTSVEEPRKSLELPTDVRVKLRKLEKLESRYHELLRSYRVAHARVLSIEPFEASLRENTPLTSISDPKALVEYLNQVNLKGDMVLDELKRVSSERDTFKQQLGDAEQSAKEAWDEVANLRNLKDLEAKSDATISETPHSRPEDDSSDAHGETKGDPLGASERSPPASIKSPTISVRGLSLFSPKSKPFELPKTRQGSEDLFSYDEEVPRLENELKGRQKKIEDLENEVSYLRGDLEVTRESTQSMVQTLEEATRELHTLRDGKDRLESGNLEQKKEVEKASEKLRADLLAAKSRLQALESEQGASELNRIGDLQAQLKRAQDELATTQSAATKGRDSAIKAEELQVAVTKLQSELLTLQSDNEQSTRKIATLNKLVATLRTQLKEAEAKNQGLRVEVEKSSSAYALLQERLDRNETKYSLAGPGKPSTKSPAEKEHDVDMGLQNGSTNAHDISDTNKKKNKKKKKANKLSVDHGPGAQSATKAESKGLSPEGQAPVESGTSSTLQEELDSLRQSIEEKNAAIDRMNGRLKDQDGLQEEIETLRDDLINVGQEHVEAKDRIKELVAEKEMLETTVNNLEKELAESHSVHEASTLGSDQRHQSLITQFEDLKSKAIALQTDLSAAQQLASSRFKDLNDLRNVLQKAQPEINALRIEAAEVKSTKEALAKKEADLKRLDMRHEEMQSEVTMLKKSVSDRELEVRSIGQKLSQETSGRLKSDEAGLRSTQEIQRLESETRKATQSLEQLRKELEKAREELLSSKTKFKEMEVRVSKANSESAGLKEEIELKSAQYASAQSLMASMRDQTTEMVVQMKEARERCESLDEEVADAHRLLSERSREGETMRRLLADVEGRAEARSREMKERMDTAIEERDRAEDEASTAGRRRAREIEDLRNKTRDIERSLKRAEDDKEELEASQRDWKRRRDELEHQAGQSTREVEEIRRAMAELRDALDESERQARDLEKQKGELRRSVEETQHRLEKLQKSNKSMADEISKVQASKNKGIDSGAPSSRSSPDSTPRIGSPAPKNRTPSAALIDGPRGQSQGTGTGTGTGTMDFVYLKNVLLQFLEQKDKKHQMQLIPVLGMLLHFDRKEEAKWMSAITSKA